MPLRIKESGLGLMALAAAAVTAPVSSPASSPVPRSIPATAASMLRLHTGVGRHHWVAQGCVQAVQCGYGTNGVP
jgi:hypothetical protein